LRDFIESEFDNAGITMLNNPCTKHCFNRAICGQAYDFDRPLEPQRDLNYGDDLWEKELCAKNYLLRRMLLAEMDGDLLAVLMMGAVQRFLESSVELREREVEECITHTPKYDDSSVRRTTKSPFISRGYRSKSVDSLANHGRTTPETSKKSFIKAYSFSSRKRFSRSSRVGVGADTNSLDESQRSSASNSMMSVSSNCSGATQSRTSDPSIPRVVEELAKCAMRGTHKHVLSSKSWLRLLILSLEPAPVAVYIVSASKVAQTRINYPIVFANKTFERISQYRRREVLGRHYSILHGEATNPAKVKLVDDAYRHGKEASVCYTNYTKHGRAFENMLSVKPLFDQQGRHRYSVCVVYNASNPGSSLSRFFLGREVIRYCPSKIVEY
jgi:PAS domain S-box-containing protein